MEEIKATRMNDGIYEFANFLEQKVYPWWSE